MKTIRRTLQSFLLLLGLLAHAAVQAKDAPVILAAASLQEALTAAADAWAQKGHPKPVISFAASSALARQIDAGAPADMFISADEDWMNYLAARKLIRTDSRKAFLGNRLVLIAPAASPLDLKIAPRFALAATLGSNKLAIADPDSVPAGRYAKAALTSLGIWQDVEGKLVRTENVRAALALVARGEVGAGIVYATDAQADKRVALVDSFPGTSHPLIVYPLALLKRSQSGEAKAFRDFLLSRQARAIFARYGFQPR